MRSQAVAPEVSNPALYCEKMGHAPTSTAFPFRRNQPLPWLSGSERARPGKPHERSPYGIVRCGWPRGDLPGGPHGGRGALGERPSAKAGAIPRQWNLF